MNPDPNLSAPAPVKRCPRCGRILPDDALFCADCGVSLADGSAPLRAPASAAPAAADAPLGVTDFLLMRIITLIPIVGLVMLLIWSFGATDNLNRRNFCRSELILYIAGQILSLILVGILSAALSGLSRASFY